MALPLKWRNSHPDVHTFGMGTRLFPFQSMSLCETADTSLKMIKFDLVHVLLSVSNVWELFFN